MSKPLFENPIFVALDVDDPKVALQLANQLRGKVGGFKLGPRLLLPYGTELVPALQKFGAVFIDNKYHDIPQTMAKAVSAAFKMGGTFVTVHTLAGEKGLSVCMQEEQKARVQNPRSRVLGVTVLTSFTQETLPEPLAHSSIPEQVESLVHLGLKSGLSAFVCSSHEIETVRKLAPDSLIITPGIRMPDDPVHDQARVMTPAEALKAGSDILVIGRSIVDASDPVLAAEKINDAIKK